MRRRELVPELSESVNNVILNMMAKKVKYRYASIEDVIKDLDAAFVRSPIGQAAGVEVASVLDEEMVAAFPAGHPLSTGAARPSRSNDAAGGSSSVAGD